jgi:hypothetical protein
MDEHWVKTLVNSLAVKIIAFGLLCLLVVTVDVALFTNKRVDILGIEFNKPSDAIDRQSDKSVQKTDTTFIQRNKNEENKNSGINKGTIGGSRNHVVNGINNGINGDVINPEKKLTKVQLNKLLNQMSKLKTEKNLSPPCVELNTGLGTNEPKVAEQIKRALVSRGYTVGDIGVAMTDTIVHGFIVDIQEQCFKIIVGVM